MTAALLSIKWTVQKLNNVDRTHLVLLENLPVLVCYGSISFLARENVAEEAGSVSAKNLFNVASEKRPLEATRIFEAF